MSKIPITKQHVLDAIDYIENQKIELKPSLAYDVIINEHFLLIDHYLLGWRIKKRELNEVGVVVF